MKTRVVVFSDYICPFCFVAALRMERLAQEEGVELEWRGFEIHPEHPPEGRAMPEGLRLKLSDPEGSVQYFAREEGVEVRVPTVLVSSRLALEATEYAREQGRLPQFNMAVFRAYWQQGWNIGQREEIAQIAREVGLDVEGLREYLSQGQAAERLREYQREAVGWGVGAVPSFVIGEGIFLEGVQAYGVFQRAVHKAAGK